MEFFLISVLISLVGKRMVYFAKIIKVLIVVVKKVGLIKQNVQAQAASF